MSLSLADVHRLEFTVIISGRKNQNLQSISYDDETSTIVAKWKDGAFIAYPNQPKDAYEKAITDESGRLVYHMKPYYKLH